RQFAPALVVAILLPAACVCSHRLDMAVGIPADPNVFPRRRNGETIDSRQHALTLNVPALAVQIAKASFDTKASNSRIIVVDVVQACPPGEMFLSGNLPSRTNVFSSGGYSHEMPRASFAPRERLPKVLTRTREKGSLCRI